MSNSMPIGQSMLGVLLVSAALSTSAMGAVGDTMLLKIDHTEGGTFTSVPNPYNGDLAVSHTGSFGDPARVYWVVPNTADPNPHLYSIQWLNVSPGTNYYQPFEVTYNGAAGDQYPIDPNIPWGGQFGTNHQYIQNDGTDTGGWQSSGPGPQTPGDPNDINVNNPVVADGNSVWLKPGSEIYVKWDFYFYYTSQTNIVSDLLITDVAPEPASLSLLTLAAAGLLARRRRHSLIFTAASSPPTRTQGSGRGGARAAAQAAAGA